MRYSKRKTFAMRIGYVGSQYFGYQHQKGKEDIKTVEGDLKKILGGVVYGAGRTDRGVHAISQVVCFITGSKDILKNNQVRIDLNGQKEEDYYLSLVRNSEAFKQGRLNAYSCYRVPRKFNSRSSATWRRYLYLFPLNNGIYKFENFGSFDLDIDFANTMLKQIEGKELPYDAFTFGDSKDQGLGLRDLCTIYRGKASVLDIGNENFVMCIELVGSRFLRRMVRILVGTLARGAHDPTSSSATLLYDICMSKDRSKTAVALPGEALCLAGVGYDPNDLAIYKFMPKKKYNEVMEELLIKKNVV